MNKKYIIPMLLLVVQTGLVVVREIWAFPKGVNIVISSIHVIASVIILLWIVSLKK